MLRPLYTVTAGEIGSETQKVEKGLNKVLELASRWNAVLLLDEADVFLEQRSNHEIERNKLVSSRSKGSIIVSLFIKVNIPQFSCEP